MMSMGHTLSSNLSLTKGSSSVLLRGVRGVPGAVDGAWFESICLT